MDQGVAQASEHVGRLERLLALVEGVPAQQVEDQLRAIQQRRTAHAPCLLQADEGGALLGGEASLPPPISSWSSAAEASSSLTEASRKANAVRTAPIA
ncbi:hypothetical protein [Streptomyces marianii]|uniref:Uncharacterized protein n=1 Tax=Streptomyces marianii TaxID=1817406 RepID=A0A5R9DUL2_9ACTN|nr:hypothetical protein [Streptomyces marianii]TLQ39471.1 hypothetical protein FEF34_39605 [Streptomyces marianii]